MAYVRNRATTIAGNVIDGPEVIGSTDYFSLHRSIIWQPGKRAVHADGLDAGQVEHLLANDLTGIPDSITNFSADPRFMDLDHGDLHLQASSPAIDYAPASTDSEADDLPRVVDLVLVPDADGFGAGPRRLRAPGHRQRCAQRRFRRGLAHLDDAAPAATSWSAEDHADRRHRDRSKSSTRPQRRASSACSQCVGIPGPACTNSAATAGRTACASCPRPTTQFLRGTIARQRRLHRRRRESGESEAPDGADWLRDHAAIHRRRVGRMDAELVRRNPADPAEDHEPDRWRQRSGPLRRHRAGYRTETSFLPTVSTDTGACECTRGDSIAACVLRSRNGRCRCPPISRVSRH